MNDALRIQQLTSALQWLLDDMHDAGETHAQLCDRVRTVFTNLSAGEAKRVAQTETLSCVNRYKFAWHIVYHYAEDVQPLLPAGTILHVVSWHDNSTANKFNPDSTNWVGFGQRTIDDMSFAWMSFYYLTDQEYKDAVAERELKKKITTDHAQ